MSTATLYRFRIDLSDIDRNIYEPLDFRLAMHPSESLPYLLTRVLAFCLNVTPGLEFSAAGLSDPEGPSLSIKNANGYQLWIEIGNPSARKLHKAAKASEQVKVYTYKNPENLIKEIPAKEIHRAERIEIFSFDPGFLELIAEKTTRDVHWNVLFHDGTLTVTSNDESVSTEVQKFSLK